MKNNLLSEKLIYTGESQTPTHLHLCTYNANEMQEVSGADFHEISSSLNSERINWLQVHGMKNTETVREICEHFEINFLVLQDILNANHPTKIEEHDNYIVLILKLFYPAPKKNEEDLDELDPEIMKKLKMNGLVQADPELVYRMDSSLGSIPVAFNKDGSFRKNSSVADRTQFAVLGRYVRTKIEKIRSSILEGDAEVSPYELGKKNACTYCPYMTVCGFDRRLSGYEFRRLKNFSDEELWKAFDREAE